MSSWYDEESVRQDLEQFQGGGALSDNIRVIHQRPPRVVLDEDEEVADIRRRFGALGGVSKEHVRRGPDLGAITLMLNTVQQCDGLSGYNIESKKDLNKSYGVVLTKPTVPRESPIQEHKIVLNPNVKEFLPRTLQKQVEITTPESENKTNSDEPLGTCCGGNKETVEKNLKSKSVEEKSVTANDDANESQINKTKYCNGRGSKASEFETLSNQLKSKITSDGSFQAKLDKNIALSKLLKLHSKQSQPKSQLKLLTPQDINPDPDQVIEVQPSKKPFEVHAKPEKQTQKIIIDVPEIDYNESSIDTTAKDLADSISKVENWMQEGNKENEKEKAVRLEKDNYKPVLTILSCFKQKVNTSSSETVQSSNSTASTSASSSRQFKPSEVASKLYSVFQNNQKATESSMQGDTIWTIAERKMKEKEEKMRLKQTVESN